MTDRNKEILRLLLYGVLAFMPFWIIVPRMNESWGEMVYMSEAAAPAVFALGTFGMLTPATAHLITRLLTKEGFSDTYLGVNFKGNLKWYLASVWVKMVESVIGAVLIWRLYAGNLTFREAFPLEQPKALAGVLLLQFAFTIIVFLPAFGEEWGWRGYMMPKLMKLLPKWTAIILGGILWGLWHAPLTIAGHNFGIDYPGYPFAGIGLMCVMCIFMNAFLTLLTEKTGSIYPASFCHMVNNNLGSTVLIILAGSEALTNALEEASTISMFLLTCLPLLMVTGILSFILFLKNEA